MTPTPEAVALAVRSLCADIAYKTHGGGADEQRHAVLAVDPRDWAPRAVQIEAVLAAALAWDEAITLWEASPTAANMNRKLRTETALIAEVRKLDAEGV